MNTNDLAARISPHCAIHSGYPLTTDAEAHVCRLLANAIMIRWPGWDGVSVVVRSTMPHDAERRVCGYEHRAQGDVVNSIEAEVWAALEGGVLILVLRYERKVTYDVR